MYCTRCGKKLNDGASFCQWCGASQDDSQAGGATGTAPTGGQTGGGGKKGLIIGIAAGVTVLVLALGLGGFFLLRDRDSEEEEDEISVMAKGESEEEDEDEKGGDKPTVSDPEEKDSPTSDSDTSSSEAVEADGEGEVAQAVNEIKPVLPEGFMDVFDYNYAEVVTIYGKPEWDSGEEDWLGRQLFYENFALAETPGFYDKVYFYESDISCVFDYNTVDAYELDAILDAFGLTGREMEYCYNNEEARGDVQFAYPLDCYFVRGSDGRYSYEIQYDNETRTVRGDDFLCIYDGIDTSLLRDTMSFTVKSMDLSGYPQVGAYVEATDLVSGDQVELNDLNYWKIRQLANGKILELYPSRVSKLDQKERLSLCLVADISGSMYGELPDVKSLMKSFVSQIQFVAGDQVALMAFDDYVYRFSRFTADANVLQGEIDQLYTGNCTALYDALYVAIGETSSQSGAKCVMAFTDGADNVSEKTAEDVIRYAKQFKIPVYLINIGYGDEDVLNRIATETGGRYYQMANSAGMQEIYQEIYTLQKNLYLVTFHADESAGDSLQTVEFLYDDGSNRVKSVLEYDKNQTGAEASEYVYLIEEEMLTGQALEDEILRIRAIYNDIVANCNSGAYSSQKLDNEITAYFAQDGSLARIIAKKGYGGIPYTQYYYYENGKLIFAYFEASDSHRMYFYQEKMFRWRYASNAVQYTEAQNHDNEDSENFRYWGQTAVANARQFMQMVGQ